MANVAIACIADNDIILWTDEAPGATELTRRNMIEIGDDKCLVLHGNLDALVPPIKSKVEDDRFGTLPLAEVASDFQSELRKIAGTAVEPFGAILGGCPPGQSPVLLSLESWSGFEVLPLGPSVVRGLPDAVWNYLDSVLNTVGRTSDNALDMLLLAGKAYRETLTYPRASVLARLSPTRGLSWLSDDELLERQTSNVKREQKLRLMVTESFWGQAG